MYGAIRQEAVTTLTLPLQQFTVVLALLANKAGRFRCIAICCTFFRLPMSVMGADFRKWYATLQTEPGLTDIARPGCNAQKHR